MGQCNKSHEDEPEGLVRHDVVIVLRAASNHRAAGTRVFNDHADAKREELIRSHES
jgi:hypothetical protein